MHFSVVISVLSSVLCKKSWPSNWKKPSTLDRSFQWVLLSIIAHTFPLCLFSFHILAIFVPSAFPLSFFQYGKSEGSQCCAKHSLTVNHLCCASFKCWQLLTGVNVTAELVPIPDEEAHGFAATTQLITPQTLLQCLQDRNALILLEHSALGLLLCPNLAF